MTRREFFRWIGAGTAIVSMPRVISGCMTNSHTRFQQATCKAEAPTNYFESFCIDKALVQRILGRALSRGGDFSEVFLQYTFGCALGMEDGEVNRAYSHIDLGAGIRVLKGDATGFAFSEDLSEHVLLKAAEKAACVADTTPYIQTKELARATVPNHYVIKVPWTEVGIEKKLPILKRTNKSVRCRDPRVIKVSVSFADATSHILVANSEGLLAEDERPMVTLGVLVVAKSNNRVEMNSKSLSMREELNYLTEKRVDALAHAAVDDTIALFDAISPPVGELPVVLGPGSSGILLHEAIGHGMEADFNRKGTSIYANRIDKRIAPKCVTIIDDGTLEHTRGAINIDDEGTESNHTVLVEDGILRTYMHDRISAKYYKVERTGSARRESFRYPPLPRMRVTYMARGPYSPQEVIASVDNGVYAESFSNGEVNIGGGDFTFFLKKGRLIKNGKLTETIKDANLIGNGPRVLERVDMVADDLVIDTQGWTCGKEGQNVPVSHGLPTVRVSGISIGGRSE